MRKIIIKSSLIFFLLPVFFLSIYSCNPRYSYHGNYIAEKDINFLKNTRLSKAEVLQFLGTPSTKTTFSDNIWYYITQVRKERAYFSIDNLSTTVLQISFSKNNYVKSYKVISGDSSVNIKINPAQTSNILEKDEGLIKDFFSSFRRRLLKPVK